ncbi:putative spermidine/putrescine transport system ATP-binding protein [Kribbella steppae]|uniref:Putative spermidine/putrescine transport system ATP-binding protein n=1 Tax=Kribbella steppae TaxID=2512223 RepID=A0A4R2HV23_9ACTN|nr:ABC transporter ATP-binding protein [Kribbella steppae]TCO35331.1 putative spermidine/putrescine transport system ATP-binding protein [Kribbella steppae]
MSGFNRLRLEGVGRRFGTADALAGLDLTIERGEFIALLGPSGCGKSTALNCLAGLLPLTAGSIWQDDRRIDTLPPEKRGFGMVFQNYALFPHLTVRDNIAFGLRMQRLPKDEVRRRTTAAIEMVRLEDHASKLPGQLSGGQQQRVAIARATVLEPSLVLMDEPLSNLDAKLRLEMRTEIRRLHQSLGLTTVYVTHDQEEALSMADRLVVMRQGRVQQIGTPEEVHTKPSSWHVADFMGYRNLLPLTAGRVSGDAVAVPLGGTTIDGVPQGEVATGDDVVAAVRPEDVKLGSEDIAGLKGRVEVVEYQGRECAIEIMLDDGTRLHARTERKTEAGEQVSITISPGRLLVYPSDGAADRPAAELASAGLAV